MRLCALGGHTQAKLAPQSTFEFEADLIMNYSLTSVAIDSYNHNRHVDIRAQMRCIGRLARVSHK